MISLVETTFVVYLLSLFLFFNCSSNFFFWILLECNMVLFICLNFYKFKFFSKMDLFDFSLFYFIVQSLGSMFFLTFSFFSSFFGLGGVIIIAIMSMALKSALFPFSFWLFSSSNSLSPLSLGVLLSLQKIPVYLFIFNISSSVIWVLLSLSMMSGSFLLMSSVHWSDVMICSSIYSSFWIFGIFYSSIFFFSYFFIVYSYFILLFCNFYYTNFFHEIMDFVTCSFFFLVFLSLPPFSFFFFKMFFMSFFFNFFSFFSFLFCWTLIFLSLFGYFKFLYFLFIPSFSTYLSSFLYTSQKMGMILGLGILPQLVLFKGKLY